MNVRKKLYDEASVIARKVCSKQKKVKVELRLCHRDYSNALLVLAQAKHNLDKTTCVIDVAQMMFLPICDWIFWNWNYNKVLENRLRF